MRYVCLLLVVACKKPSPIAVDDAPSPRPTPTVAASAVAAVESAVADTRTPAHLVADRWNAAHDKRDAKDFEAVYAPHVAFYGQALSNAECVKRKIAALEKSPGYTQSIHSWMYGQAETPDDKGATRVIFTKTTIEHGKSHDYIALLTIDRSLHITEELDRTSEQNLAKSTMPWCMDGYNESNARIRPPFKISSNTAIASFGKSKHLAALQASATGQAYGVDGFDCTDSCVTTQPRQCGYDIRVIDAASTAISRLVEWVYVDGITNVLWYRDGSPDAGLDDWLSEPLTP